MLPEVRFGGHLNETGKFRETASPNIWRLWHSVSTDDPKYSAKHSCIFFSKLI